MERTSGFDPTRPFTRAEGLAAGLSPWQLRGRQFVRLHRNVYVARSTTRTLELRARAALRAAPAGSVLSHATAALLWGGAVPAGPDLHLWTPPGTRSRIDGVSARARDVKTDVRTRRGLLVTSPERTFCDLAPDLDLLQLVVLGDRLVRRGHTTPHDLAAFAWSWTGPRSPLARRAAGLVRAGVDSPPETRLRLLIVLAGLPEPAVDLIIRDPRTGAWLRRFELAYEELLIAIEYEGRHHRSDDDVWSRDIDRREELDRRSWRVVQMVSTGLFDHPLRTLQRIEQARTDRGAPPTRVLAEEWRRYFPGRDAA